MKSAVAFAVVGVCAYYGYRGYLETRVNAPFAAPAVVDRTGAASSPLRFWGSYRPGVYFGLKTRSPADLLAGLMWMLPGKVAPSNLGLRHWCDQNDGLSRSVLVKCRGFGAANMKSAFQRMIFYISISSGLLDISNLEGVA